MKSQLLNSILFTCVGLVFGFAGGYYVNQFTAEEKTAVEDPYAIKQKPKKVTAKPIAAKKESENVVVQNSEELNSTEESPESNEDLTINDSVLIETDSIHIADTSIVDSLPEPSKNIQLNDEIVVREDVLLSSQKLPLVKVTDEYDSTLTDTTIDSKLSKQSDIKPTRIALQLEYWETPLNSKGYTMNNKVLRIYGLDPDENAKLFELDNRRYLQHFDGFYIIEESYEMRALRKESRPYIINQIIDFGL